MHSRLKLDWWKDVYLNQEMWRIDPVYRATLTTTLPLWWSYDARPRLVVGFEQNATAQQLHMFQYCFKNTGVRSGLSVPMHTAFGGFGYIVFASRAPLDELSSSGKLCEDSLLAIAHRFHHDVAPSLGLLETSEVKLSSRELDCLSLAALGKTLDESAQILSLSRSTVRFHLRNACTRLGVSNRMQAVTRAAYLGLLGPTF
jgi:DNA-binding CsgD family transcriptional regulator